MLTESPLPPDVLPPGARARFIDGVNGLRMHVQGTGLRKVRPAVPTI